MYVFILCLRKVHNTFQIPSFLIIFIINILNSVKCFFFIYWDDYRKLYEIARAAITKYHRLGNLNNRHVFSHIPGGCRSKIQVLAGLVSSKPLSLTWPSLCVLTCPFLCPHESLVSLCVSKFSLLIRTPLRLE